MDGIKVREAASARLFDQLRDGVVLSLPGGRVVDANPSACRMFGGSLEELVGGRRWLPLDDTDPRSMAALEEHERTGLFNGRVRLRRRSGEAFEAEVLSSLLAAEGGRAVVVTTVRDLADLVRFEAALRENKALLRSILDHFPGLVSAKDLVGNVLFVNRGFEVLAGPPREEFVGRNVFELFPPDVAKVLWANDLATQRAGRALQSEEVVAHRDGTHHTYLTTKFPLFRDETMFATCAISVDVTAQRELEERLLHARKMEALGQLAGGVAHDFNNLLAAMMLQLWEVRRQLGTHDVAASRDLDEVLANVERAAELTRQLLLFSRRGPISRVPCEVLEVVASARRMLARTLGGHIELEVSSAEASPHVDGDFAQLELVLLNLCINARDAMPDGGCLRIEVLTVDRPELEPDPKWPTRAPGRFVSLSVRDTGRGIAVEHLHRLFEPFFTTKAPGRGTGLGLSSVHGVVVQHGGWVEVQSMPGSGSEFTVFLPVSKNDAARERTPAIVWRRAEAGHLVLLVEDDERLRRVATAALKRLGYAVLPAADAEEAVLAWHAHSDEIDLLFTDLVMPGGSGLELARRLRAERPGLPILLASGYGGDHLPDEMRHLPGFRFLAKPYEPHILGNALAELLEVKRGT